MKNRKHFDGAQFYLAQVWVLSVCSLVTFSLIPVNGDFHLPSVQLQSCENENSEVNGTDETHKNWTVPTSISGELIEFTVSLVPGKLKCKRKLIEIKLNGLVESSEFVQEREKIFSNGYLYPNKSDVEYFHPFEYCISEITKDHVKVKYCEKLEESQVRVTNIPKCCPMSKLFTLSKVHGTACTSAKEGSSPFHPILYENPETKYKGQSVIHYNQKRKKTFNCPNKLPPLLIPHATINPYAKDIHGLSGLCYRIRDDGILLYLNVHYQWNEISRENYCFDGVQIEEAGQPFGGQEGDFGVTVCAIPQNSSQLRSVMYGWALIISSIFLLLTFVVYVLWNQKNIHGWTTMSYTGSMFFMYLFLGTAYILLYTWGHEVTQTRSCKALAILAQFFVLSTFCWLTVRSFDLFWTFRGMKARSQRSKGVKRFLIYAGFGWGLPLIFTVISVIIDSIYGSDPCNTVIVPAYGSVSCYLQEQAFGLYLYYPIGLLLSLNLLFVALTTYKLYVYNKGTRMATMSMNYERQQMFKIFIKLFFVMGVSWIFEFVSWWHSGHELNIYWAILDLINLLQGAAIFIIFVCKADILRSLKTQYPSLHPILNPLGQCLRCHSSEMDPSTTMTAGSNPSLNHLRMSTKQLNQLNET